MSWRGRGSLPYVTAGLGEVNPVKMLCCQGFIDKLCTGLQAGIPHEKGRERRQISQGEGVKDWNKFIFIQSFGGGARVRKLEFPCPVPSPCAHQASLCFLLAMVTLKPILMFCTNSVFSLQSICFISLFVPAEPVPLRILFPYTHMKVI